MERRRAWSIRFGAGPLAGLGWGVARWPLAGVLCCLVVFCTAGSGLLRLYVEDNPLRLWLPAHSISAANEARQAALTDKVLPRNVARKHMR